MIGPASALTVDVQLPPGISLRRVTEERDIRAMSAMQDEVFGDSVSDGNADAILRRVALDDGMELWVAEHEGSIVSAGRLEPVPRHGIRRHLGRGDARRVARPGYLPGRYRGPGTGRVDVGQNTHP